MPWQPAAIELTPDSPDAYLVRAGFAADQAIASTLWRMLNRRSHLCPVIRDCLSSGQPSKPRRVSRRPHSSTSTARSSAVPRVSVRIPRALALMALGRNEAAVHDWSLALEDDAEDPEAYLGRATALIRLNRADRALVDLDQAADWAADSPVLLARITTAYAVCLGSARSIFSLATPCTSNWSAWTTSATSPASAPDPSSSPETRRPRPDATADSQNPKSVVTTPRSE